MNQKLLKKRATNRSLVFKRLLCSFFIVFSLSASAQIKEGKIYALIVGISQYSSPADNLTYPSKDAIEIYNLLKKRTAKDRISLLVNQSATHDNILKAANQLFTSTNKNDIVIFYFSGHGYKGGFVTHDKRLQYAELKAIFKKTKAKRKIIFADACFAGDLRTNNTRQNERMIDVENQKVCLFLSSRSNQFSMESPELKNGFFTFFLIAGLRGGADADRNKIITARELFDFVNPKVKQYSNGSQVPVMWGKFDYAMKILNWNK